MGTCGSFLLIVSIFSAKMQSRSGAESEDVGGGVGSLGGENKDSSLGE